MSELKACPFCGGEAQLQTPEDMGSIEGSVMCMSCYASDKGFDNWKDAIEAWNTRTLPDGMVNLAMSGETVKLISRTITLKMNGDPDKVFPSGKTALEVMEPVAIKVIEAMLEAAKGVG